MPSVSFSVEMKVDNRLKKYLKVKKLDSRTDGIDNLLKKVGY